MEACFHHQRVCRALERRPRGDARDHVHLVLLLLGGSWLVELELG